MNKRVVSLDEALREGGYHTYMAGKWHLGHAEGTSPFDRGFERTSPILSGEESNWADVLGVLPRDDPAEYSRNGKQIEKLPGDFYSSRSYANTSLPVTARHDVYAGPVSKATIGGFTIAYRHPGNRKE